MGAVSGANRKFWYVSVCFGRSHLTANLLKTFEKPHEHWLEMIPAPSLKSRDSKSRDGSIPSPGTMARAIFYNSGDEKHGS